MKNFLYVGFLIIFISMVFTLMIFSNFTQITIACQARDCNNFDMFVSMLFGFVIIGLFVMVDAMVAYIILKQKPWEMMDGSRVAKPSGAKTIKALEAEYEHIEQAKADAEEQYYKGKFDSDTFQKMLNSYEQKMIEMKSRIKRLKVKQKKVRGADKK